MEKHY